MFARWENSSFPVFLRAAAPRLRSGAPPCWCSSALAELRSVVAVGSLRALAADRLCAADPPRSDLLHAGLPPPRLSSGVQ